MSRRQAPITHHDLPTDLGQVGSWSAPDPSCWSKPVQFVMKKVDRFLPFEGMGAFTPVG
jgi:hypothetical protein